MQSYSYYLCYHHCKNVSFTHDQNFPKNVRDSEAENLGENIGLIPYKNEMKHPFRGLVWIPTSADNCTYVSIYSEADQFDQELGPLKPLRLPISPLWTPRSEGSWNMKLPLCFEISLQGTLEPGCVYSCIFGRKWPLSSG